MTRRLTLLLLVPVAIGVGLYLRGGLHAVRGPSSGSAAEGAVLPATEFERAVARARATERPLLVLIQPVQEGCPPAERLLALFQRNPELERWCVPVLADGGPDTSAVEVRVVTRARRGRTLPPLLAVVTPDLEVLHVQAAHLMGFYSGGGHQTAAEECEALWGGPEMILLVRNTLARKAEVERLLALSPDETPAGRVERAERLAEIGRLEEATAAALAAAKERLPMAEARRLLAVLLQTDDDTHARRFADGVLAARGAEPEAGWILLEAQPVRGPVSPEAFASAAENARADGQWILDLRLQAARLRARAAHLADADVLREVRDLHQRSADTFAGHPQERARFLDDLARAAAAGRDVELAERLIRQLNREHSESDEAVLYRHGQLDRLRDGLDLRVVPRRSTGQR